jgi:multidrug efflux pump subunit AcrA (membrane-fusion protein)
MNSGNRKRPRLWIVMVSVIVVTAAAAGGLRQFSRSGAETADGAERTRAPAAETARPPEQAITLEGERIAVRPVQRSVGVVGSFHGYDEVVVTAEVSGRVAKVLHDVGDVVHPGDVLLELDTQDFALELEQTRRALELEVVRLGVTVPEEPLSMDEIAAVARAFDIRNLPSVIRAQKLEELARLRLERAQDLFDGKAISEEGVQSRRSEYDVAAASLSQATYDAQAAVAAIRHRAVQLRIAQRKLELASIRAPTPTRRPLMPEPVQYAVVERKVTEGEMLKDAPGLSSATFKLVMDGVLKLEAQVPERYASDVKEGQEAQIRVDAYPGRTFLGKVQRINPAVDRTSRTFHVQIYVDNAARELKAGGFAETEILTRVDPQAWTVSPESLATSAGATRIFVERDGKAHAVSVAKGIEGPAWVELIRAEKADLRLEDIVIRGGHDKLAEGTPVQIRNAAALKQVAERESATR